MDDGIWEYTCPSCRSTGTVEVEEMTVYMEIGVAFNSVEVAIQTFDSIQVQCTECLQNLAVFPNENNEIDSAFEEQYSELERKHAFSSSRQWWE